MPHNLPLIMTEIHENRETTCLGSYGKGIIRISYIDNVSTVYFVEILLWCLKVGR